MHVEDTGTMKSLESEAEQVANADGVHATLMAFFEAWQTSGDAATDQAMSCLAAQFTGLGTGPRDVYETPGDLRAVLERERASALEPSPMEILFLRTKYLRADLALVDGQVDSVVIVDGHQHVVNPRFTVIMDQQEGTWVICYFHFSLPDASQAPGDTLVDALRARTSQLEHEVAQRTAELHRSLADLKATQAQLIQQEKMASLGRLTSGIAHELKNPLNFINNFAALSRDLAADLQEALDDLNADERSELLEDLVANAQKIEAHGQRADAIVESMMQHARPQRSTRRRVDLHALLDEYIRLALQQHRAAWPESEAVVRCEWDPAVERIEIVPSDIGRVLLNVLSNAFDAVSNEVEPLIVVSTERRDNDVLMRVADNGVGISRANQLKIFEPFFTTKPPGQGTGLGLSLSYDIITQGHSGTLTVESQEGRGATFTVSLPTSSE
ncbi:MAG: hypothetical protein RhofKO_35050 [Rhodothermales bacterium]